MSIKKTKENDDNTPKLINQENSVNISEYDEVELGNL